MRTSNVVSALAVTLAAAAASAQGRGLTLPQSSPPATVVQTVGLTEVKITYHRPAVNKRKVWGELVPYREVWRAGANDNTTIAFSSPVKVEGKPLPAGTYGLHMIPNEKEWTIIFSKTSVAWGSFSYDEKEDALRVKVASRAAAFQERLSYAFDDPTETAVTIALRWDKLEVPFKVEVDTPAVVMASMRDELRGVARFNWLGWNQAARYWVRNGGNIDEALQMVDRSIGMNENYQNLSTRASILEKQGDAKAAATLRDKAMQLATEADLNQQGYELLGAKKVNEAIAIFERNAQAHPASWNVHDSLGEAYLAKGDKKAAQASYAKALALVKDDDNRKRIEQTLAKLKGK